MGNNYSLYGVSSSSIEAHNTAGLWGTSPIDQGSSSNGQALPNVDSKNVGHEGRGLGCSAEIMADNLMEHGNELNSIKVRVAAMSFLMFKVFGGCCN
ncbi:hypothetical protein V6N13_074779 [Hibiscus sabdariffa]